MPAFCEACSRIETDGNPVIECPVGDDGGTELLCAICRGCDCSYCGRTATGLDWHDLPACGEHLQATAPVVPNVASIDPKAMG